MPAALVPRPWDFEDPPKGKETQLPTNMVAVLVPEALPGTEVIVDATSTTGGADSASTPAITVSPPPASPPLGVASAAVAA